MCACSHECMHLCIHVFMCAWQVYTCDCACRQCVCMHITLLLTQRFNLTRNIKNNAECNRKDSRMM